MNFFLYLFMIFGGGGMMTYAAPFLSTGTDPLLTTLKINENRRQQTGDCSRKERKAKVYARFVPERDDDFAWENDRVAFRAYGPALQHKAERHQPGGLVTSGIDCWFKRVDYPVIDRWYGRMDYHRDHGEGLDAYEVGASRGCGGTAICHKGRYVVSKNFTDYRILEQSADKVVFQLSYAPVLVGGLPVKETKTITLKSGDHFYRCEVAYETEQTLKTMAAGLALHQHKGTVRTSPQGWAVCWENIRNEGVGTAVWCAAPDYRGYAVEGKEKGSNANVWLHIALKDNRASYCAGFNWTKAGHHANMEEWVEYVEKHPSLLEAF